MLRSRQLSWFEPGRRDRPLEHPQSPSPRPERPRGPSQVPGNAAPHLRSRMARMCGLRWSRPRGDGPRAGRPSDQLCPPLRRCERESSGRSRRSRTQRFAAGPRCAWPAKGSIHPKPKRRPRQRSRGAAVVARGAGIRTPLSARKRPSHRSDTWALPGRGVATSSQPTPRGTASRPRAEAHGPRRPASHR